MWLIGPYYFGPQAGLAQRWIPWPVPQIILLTHETMARSRFVLEAIHFARGSLNCRPFGKLAGDSDGELSRYPNIAWLGNGGRVSGVSFVTTTVTAK